jgi:hypothetical protein
MDDQLGKPVWLPNANVERQVEFYLRQPAQVVAQAEFPTGGDAAKTIVAGEGDSRAAVAESRVAKQKRPVVRPNDLERSAPPSSDSAAFIAASEQTKPTWFERAAALFRLPRLAPEAPESPTNEFGNLDRAFRASHGTDYNPGSATDRRKMEHLKQALLGNSRSTHTQTF